MREIKFRAWDKESEIMRKVKALTEYGCTLDMGWADKNHTKRWDSFFKNENTVIMQYTGMKDKNGIEIYEGDIFDIERSGERTILVVEFVLKDFSYKAVAKKWIKKTCGTLIDVNLVAMKDYKVIGNIFENPELLEVKNDI